MLTDSTPGPSLFFPNHDRSAQRVSLVRYGKEASNLAGRCIRYPCNLMVWSVSRSRQCPDYGPIDICCSNAETRFQFSQVGNRRFQSSGRCVVRRHGIESVNAPCRPSFARQGVDTKDEVNKAALKRSTAGPVSQSGCELAAAA
nr:hypothetical protein CFP56_52226 [Quercus suber]